MPRTPQEIDATATAMQQAGAPDTDIRAYVQAALSENAGPMNTTNPIAAMRDQVNSGAMPAQTQPPVQAQGGDWQQQPQASHEFGGASSPYAMAMPQNTQQMQTLARASQQGSAQLPYLAAMMVPGGQGVGINGLLASTGMRAGAGGLAYLANRGIEGEKPKLSEAAKTMLSFGAPIPSELAKVAPFLEGGIMKSALVGAGTQAGTVLAANAAEQALGEQPMSWDRYKDSAREAYLPAAIGAVAGGVSGKLTQMSKIQQQADAAKQGAAELGMTDPMLGDLLPKQYGTLQQQVVAKNPAMAMEQRKARAPLVNAMLDIVGKAPKNEDVATGVQPLIGKLDELAAQDTAAQQRFQAAQQARAVAKAKTDLPPDVRDKIVTGAQAETMNAIQDEAKSIIAQNAQADAIGTQTGKAEAVQDIVKKTFDAREQIASDMLEKTGIPKDAAVVGVDALAQSAEAAMGSDAKGTIGQNILSTIRGWGSKTGSDVAKTRKMTFEDLARKAANEGRDLTIQEVRALNAPTGAMAPDSKAMTMDDFRELRNGISGNFIGKIDDNNMSNAERIAAKAYLGMREAQMGEVAKMFPDAVAPLEEFNQFWHETSKLRDSAFGRALLNGEVSDGTLGAMANKLASGQEDEVRNFKRFMDVIGQHNPDVANAAMATTGSAVGNSFKNAAYDAATGGTDYRKLGNMLQAYSSKKDATFPVQLFGMGDAATISGWQKALRQFAPHELSNGAISSIMESPQIQSVLKTGGKDMSEQLSKAYATVAFTKRVNDAVALENAGLMRPAREAYVNASKLAAKAGIDADTAQQALTAAQANPMHSVFKGKGGYNLTNDASKFSGQGTINELIGGMKESEASAFMTKLREERPDLADMVARRYLANTMKDFQTSETVLPGELNRLNIDKVREFFNPPAQEGSNPLEKLRIMIGSDKMAEVRKFAHSVAAINEGERAGKIAAKVPDDIVEGLRLGRTAQAQSPQAGGALAGTYARLKQMVREKRFNLLSSALLDDGFKNALNRSSGNVADALSSLPMQKSYLLLQDARILGELGNKNSTSSPTNQQQQNNSQRP